MRTTSANRTKVHAGALLLVITAIGCGTNEAIIHDDYAGSGGTGGIGGSGGSGGVGGSSSSAIGPLCAGECAPLGPAEWSGPALVWMGKPSEAPECPASAPVVGELGSNDLTAPLVCGACSCGPPSGSCGLPTVLTAASTGCSGAAPGVTHTAFDAPAGWSGSCNATSSIAANQKCNGVNCVQSLTVAPLTLIESPCGASTGPRRSELTHAWGAVARSCNGIIEGTCEGAGELCSPVAEPGLLRCISRDGDHACPGSYPDRHVFFESFTDTRSCSPCGCSAPAGSTCTALVSAYGDSACSALIGAVTVDASGPACLDVLPSGAALGSKLAKEPHYVPGVCQVSGGAGTGVALPTNPSTICCLP